MQPPNAPPTKSPYRKVAKDDLILRDVLATDRTVLANERTLLSYVRTALGLLAGGASLIHFFDVGWLQVAGWVMVPFAPLVLVAGLWSFQRVRKNLKHLR
ncbi:MAG TPA: DUF202 domain-containing protein [Rhodothermales bacterium]|nr:DUF202 domain-containing protein [Rhodothermales bacterium]